MPSIGVPELLIVLVVAVLILGPKRIPAAARSVGEGIRGFRGSLKGGSSGKDDPDESSEAARIKEKSNPGA
ncbi:MAG: twin-arginine translocase TatA/TatE family subunit [Solirubrobacterales bacterium]|nr:twin-arginine translocase TatA/TatE family subunit [Solirubrobacterales bacterium]MCO5316787.1 twin-arginine translocase TatA/TatE family subunit [Solirubrobacterales bacterium]